MSELIHDPMFFYAVAFLVFMGAAWKYGRAPVTSLIDAEIIKIGHELERARTLRAEAETLLAGYKTRQTQALAEAEDIVRHAAEEAARLKTQAKADLAQAAALQNKRTQERIRIAEAEALAAIRAAVIERAVAKAADMMSTGMNEAIDAQLIEQAMASIPAHGVNARAA